MHLTCQKLFLTHLLLHASVYSVNNFMTQMLKSTNTISNRQISLVNLVIFFKFIAIMGFSHVADKYKNHRIIIGTNLILSAMFLLFLYFSRIIATDWYRTIFVICSYTFYNITIGGTFSLLDALSYNFIEQIDKHYSYYGKLRLGGTIGNILIHFLMAIVHFIFSIDKKKKENKENVVNLVSGVFFGVLAALSCFLLPEYVVVRRIPQNKSDLVKNQTKGKNIAYKIEKNTNLKEIHEKVVDLDERISSNEDLNIENQISDQKIEIDKTENQKLEENENKNESQQETKTKKKKMGVFQVIGVFRSIASPMLVAYSFALLFQGIDRVTLSLFLSYYLEERGVDRSFVHLSLLIRYLPEVLIYSFSAIIGRYLPIDMMFLIASLVATVRTLFFAFETFDFSSSLLGKIVVIFVEITKGLYSAFLNYSCLRIFRLLSTKSTASFGQGLYTAIYNGLAYTVCAPIGYFVLEEDESQNGVQSLKSLFLIVGFISSLSIIIPFFAMFNNKWRKRQTNLKN